MKPHRRFLLLLLILLIAALAGFLRLRAVNLLPVDYDEDDYLRSAQEYATVIQSGDWNGFTQFNYRPEHPPLAKIAMGVAIAGDSAFPMVPDRPTSADPDSTLPRLQLTHARLINAIFGTLTVLALAALNPLAGLLLGLHSFTIKYVSQVMLEALPALTSLIAVLCYLGFKRSARPARRTAWLAGSAIFLGLSVASKYLYAVAGIAILIDWVWTKTDALPNSPFASRRSFAAFLRSCLPILAWGILAVVVFFASDPYLWPAPVQRLKESVLYHAGYAAGAAEVKRSNYPIWQPFVWLGMSPVSWHGAVFLTAPDPFIALLALVGFGRTWRKNRTIGIWLIVAFLFLLVWPTKWPQYILTLTAPLSLAAAEGIMALFVDPARDWWARRKAAPAQGQMSHRARGEVRRAAPWLFLGLIAFLFLTILPLLFQVGMSMTTLEAQSLKDGLNGGLPRELWGGITGQIQAGDNGIRSQVHYIGLLGYPGFFDYISNLGLPVFSLLWTVLSVALQLALGLAAAMLLWNRHVLLRKSWQTFFILPWAIPEAIGALLWLNVLAPTFGWLALAVQEYGKAVPFSFLVGWEKSPNLTLAVLLIATLWYGFPFMMLAVSTGLKLIPIEVLDASAIDGASGWQTFQHVFWPLLTPLVVPAIIIRGIFAFNQFYLFQMFVPVYGDQSPLVTLSTYSYYLIYRGSQFSFSAIINVITILMLLCFVILFNRWSKAGEGVTYA